MLLDSVIIVLRETLEAGVLISLLLALGHELHLGRRWLWLALPLGISSAYFYAVNLRVISSWLDHAGQEVVNAGLQYSIYLVLLALITHVRRGRNDPVACLMSVATVLAVVREGAEIMVFYDGYLHKGEQLVGALTSGFVGLMVGFSVGTVSYFSLLMLARRFAQTIHVALLILIGSGMVLQATQLLEQVDWLPASTSVWSTEALLAEGSLPGQLCYAIFGYESTPTTNEVLLYCFALLLGVGISRLPRGPAATPASGVSQ